jgi:hypothetical protein
MREDRGCAMLPDWTILLTVLRENVFNKLKQGQRKAWRIPSPKN